MIEILEQELYNGYVFCSEGTGKNDSILTKDNKIDWEEVLKEIPIYEEPELKIGIIFLSPSDITFQTYTKLNPTTGKVYSGRTSGKGTPLENVANRDAKHHMNDKGFGPAKLDKSSSNSDAIRGREQQLIDKNGGAKSQGGTSGNGINGVSSKNKNLWKYLEDALEEFGK